MKLVLISLIIVFSAILVILQYGKTQTFLTEQIVDLLVKKTDADIRFDKIQIHPFNTVLLKNVAILDDCPADTSRTIADTLGCAEYIIVKMPFKQLLHMKKGKSIHIQQAIIKNGSFNLVLEDNGTNIDRIFKVNKQENKEKKPLEGDLFDINKVNIEDFRFTLKNLHPDESVEHADSAMNWADLDVKDINTHISKLKFSDGIVYGNMHSMSFTEKSGYVCNNISGQARVGRGLTLVKDLNVRDKWSDIHLNEFTMRYANIASFQNFLEEVELGGSFDPTQVSFKSIGYFAGSIKYVTFGLNIKGGSVDGPVKDLHVHDFAFNSPSENIEAKISAEIKNIPDLEKMHFDIDLNHLKSSFRGIEDFIKFWAPNSKIGIKNFAKGTRFNIHGTGQGYLHNLALNMKINSSIGQAHANIVLSDMISPSKPFGIGGKIRTTDLNAGKIFNINNLEECSIATQVDARFQKGGSPEVNIDTLKIDRLRFNEYDYHNITAKGNLKNDIFDGGIVCNEPNLSFMLAGAFAVSPKTNNSVYKFYGKVGYIDLQALNLDKRGMSKASFSTQANFNWVKQEDIIGNIKVSGLMLENEEGRHDIGDITVSSHSSDDLSRIAFKSDFAEGKFSGSGSFLHFIKDISELSVKRELPALFTSEPGQWSGNNYKFSFKFNNSMSLMAFVLPGAYIAEGTALNLSINKEGTLDALLKSQRLALHKSANAKELFVKDLECTVTNTDNYLQTRATAGEIKLSGVSLKNNAVQIMADDNYFGLEYLYSNGDGTYLGNGVLNGSGNIYRDSNNALACHVDILPSEIEMNSHRWDIAPAAVDINNNSLLINDFSLRCEDQFLFANGRVAFKDNDVLGIQLGNIDISFLDNLMENPLNLAGQLSGTAEIVSSPETIGINMDMKCENSMLGGYDIGCLNLACDWNGTFKKFDIRASNNLKGVNTFDARAVLTPSINDLNADVKLDGFELGYITPLVKSIFTQLTGDISGKIHAEGPLNRLKIASKNLYLSNGKIEIDYTRVPYNVRGSLAVDEYGLYFDKITINDGIGGRGDLKGKLYYDHFKDFGLEIDANIHRLKCLQLSQKDNEYFYGDLTGSGDLNLRGPFNALTLEVNAVTNDQGALHIPINSSATAGSTNLLKFKEPISTEIVDPYELMVNRMKKKKAEGSDFAVKIHASATPQVTAYIEIDKTSGNVLSGRGEGNIDLNIKKDVFDIRGDYSITSGNYKFVALGLASRDFSIQDGSSIKFGGDIMNSTLDINAIYKTKTSLSTLISDTSSVNTRKIVECGINITDKIMNPRLKFSINVPDIDPTIQSKVKNALSTDDKIQKQFLSLIISNSFLPDEQSGIVNNSAVLYSNVTEIMSNQLNNILQKLNIPLDMGFDYQPNNKGRDIFDVAVSTQLFNNRVIVNGNIGNKQYSNNNTNTEVVGDLDIEIKLDKSGALRLNIFSHSADQYTNYLDNSQRNGVGLTYQREFNHFGDLFMSKKRRQELESSVGSDIPKKKIKIGEMEEKKDRKKNKK